MERKVVSGIMLSLLLISMLTWAFCIQLVKAEPRTWYVDDSGGADFTRIQDAIYAASPGDTIYVYNGTYYECIFISTPLTLIGENKYAAIIDGSGYGPIVSVEASPVNFISFTVRNAGWAKWLGIAIYLESAGLCKISDNIVKNSRYGIALPSPSSIICNNVISGAELGIANFETNFSADNKIVGNRISNSSTGIYLNYPWNNQITGNTISNMTGEVRYGIHFEMGGSKNAVVENTVLGYCDYGIAIRYADENYVAGNTLIDNFYGIELSQSSCDNTVTGNNVSGNGVGISIFANSDNNLITMNKFSDSVSVGFYISNIGIWVESSYDNIIHCNAITNTGYGFYLPSSSNNKIYHNNIINNTIQVYSFESANMWDDGYPSGGNYWSDYKERYPSAKELDDSGIWDTAYVIDADNRDRYPLMKLWSTLSISAQPPIVTVGSDVTISGTITPVRASVDLTIYYRLVGEEDWTLLVAIKTNSNGVYIYVWKTTQIGTYELKAIWLGDETTFPAESNIVSINVEPIHDVAVTSVVPSATEVYIGWKVNITIVVKNEGNATETFTVTYKYDLEGVEYLIGTRTVNNIAPNMDTTLTFTWATKDITVHTLKAEILPLPRETDTADNSMTSPTTVKVKMLGDVNNDNMVDIRDIAQAGLALGSYLSHPRWNIQADVYQDNKVDIRDLALIAKNFGKTYP